VRLLSIWTALLLAACSKGAAQISAPTRIDALSTTNLTSNAGKLRQFVDQECFDRLENPNAFQAGLMATGWPAKRTQTANPDDRLALDVWELPGATLLRGQPVKNGVWTCTLMVKSSVAPTTDTLEKELSKLAGSQPANSGEWWWKRSRANKIHMDVTESRQGVTINIENYHLPWWQSFLE
jgi:hypothetical protein